MAKTIVIDCRKRADGLYDVWEFPSTWSGLERASGVPRKRAWEIADGTHVGRGQRLSVRGLGRRRKGE